MNIKSIAFATIAGSLVFFFLQWLFHNKLLYDFFVHNPGQVGIITRTEPSWVFFIIGCLCQALFLAVVLPKWNVFSFSTGLIPGALFGFLMAAAYGFTMYGTTFLLSKKGMAAEILASTVIASLAGGVIGAVIGFSEKKQ